jgi:hypothetical protein
MTADPVRIAQLKEHALADDAARAELRRLALANSEAGETLDVVSEHYGFCRTNPSPRMMPRSASRLTLVVTSVRAEPLHEISADDAEREGLWRVEARRHLFWRHVTECRLFERDRTRPCSPRFGTASTAAAPGIGTRSSPCSRSRIAMSTK